MSEGLVYEDDAWAAREVVRVSGGPPPADLSPFGRLPRLEPCALVIFGVTGDLARRKLLPALYDLACHGALPASFALVGYGRRPLDDGGLADLVREAVAGAFGREAPAGAACERVLAAPHYVQGGLDEPDGYRRLAAVLAHLDREHDTAGNRLFYLAVPPSQFPIVVRGLHGAGLARRGAYDGGHAAGEPVAGWTRLLVEKPFGRDLASARELNRCVGAAFDERQVCRIDHYLAKETVQNLLVLRFANTIFEPVWNRRYVDHVQITAAETLGVEHRGAYYEETGALRDMLAPHLLQLLTLVAMEPPVTFAPGAVHDEKVKVLRAVEPPPPERVAEQAVRAQYVRGVADGEVVPGYREEEGVAPDSSTETYAALRLMVRNWRWDGVPFYLRTGKRLARKVTEVAVQFRRPPVAIFGAGPGSAGPAPNTLVLRIQPDEGFSLHIESKLPGQGMRLQPVAMDYSYGSTLRELPFSAYETVLVDAMEGDMMLFQRADQVEAAWAVVQPVLDVWAEPPASGLPVYEAGSQGPEAADALVARDGRAWRRI